MTRARELALGCFFLVALVVTGFLALQVRALSGLGARQVHVDVALPNAQGINVGAVVAVAGVEVGSVASLSVDHDRAIVGLAVDASAQLKRGVQVHVRSRSMLGERYIELTPASRDGVLLVDGDRLDNVLAHTEIDQLVNALGPLVAGIDPGILNATLQAIERALEEDPERLARILVHLDTSLQNASAASELALPLLEEGRGVVDDARRTLGVIEARALETRGVIVGAETVLGRLEEVVEPAPALVADVERTVSDVRALVEGLEGSTDDIAQILSNLKEIDRWELRRLLREEGIAIRTRPARVERGEEDAGQRPRIRRH